jgi:antitoxin Phd
LGYLLKRALSRHLSCLVNSIASSVAQHIHLLYYPTAAARVHPMKTYPLNEARADFSKLVDRALAGEPQRITRYGKEAVVVVSEDAWTARSRSAPTLGALLAQHARAETVGDDMTDRPWKVRPLGEDFK